MLSGVEVFTLTFYAIMIVTIIVANGIVILSICCIKKLRSTSNALIVSLSFADFCIGLLTVPIRGCEILQFGFTHTIEYCRVAHAFTLLNFTASVSNLVVITIDRYIAISHPYLYLRLKTRSVSYIGMLLSFAWISVILITFMPLYAWGSNGQSGPRKGRLGICRFNETLTTDFILTVLSSIIACSCLCIIAMYVRIFIIAKRQIKRIAPHQDFTESDTMPDPSPAITNVEVAARNQQAGPSMATADLQSFIAEQRKRNKNLLKSWKIAKTMFLIVCIFLVSWGAFVGSTLMFVVCKKCANGTVVSIATILIYGGSCANPFVYFIKFKSFRIEMKRTWRKIRQHNCCRL